jgi:hypothetical protein
MVGSLIGSLMTGYWVGLLRVFGLLCDGNRLIRRAFSTIRAQIAIMLGVSGGQEVASSNLVSPTNAKRPPIRRAFLFVEARPRAELLAAVTREGMLPPYNNTRRMHLKAFWTLAFVLSLTIRPAFAATGIAFDQIIMSSTARPLPAVKDFERVWADEIATLKAHAADDRLTRDRQFGEAVSIAYLGDMVRTEFPIDGTVIIEQPSLHRTVYISNPAKTYSIQPFSGRGDVYSVGVAPGDPKAQLAHATMKTVFDYFPDQTLDGIVYAGVAGRIIQTVSDSKCKFAQAVTFFVTFAAKGPKEPFIPEAFYGISPDRIVRSLSSLSGCAVLPPPDYANAFPTYPGFLLYKIDATILSDHDVSLESLPEGLPEGLTAGLLMRGHVRILSDADMAMFQVPPGYRLVRSP